MSDALPELGRVGLAFPGVGARPAGHERALYLRRRALFDPLLEEASALAGADLRAPLAEAPGELRDDRHGQLFTYAFGCGLAAVCSAAGLEPVAVAGHSFGLYAALEASGALTYSEGLAVAEEAYRAAEQAASTGTYAMAVVVGLREGELGAALAGLPSVRLVNSNHDESHVLAGEASEVERALEAARAAGAFKALGLEARAPYHHPVLLRGASDRLDRFLEGLRWARPRCPVVSAFDGGLVDEPSALRALTADNLSSPIRWQAAVRGLAALDLDAVVECGPGVSLAQNARMVEGAPRFVGCKGLARRLAP